MKKKQAEQFEEIVIALRSGGVAIFPTDSSYAIGCRITSRSGIREVMRHKRRHNARFTVVASSLAQVRCYFRLNACQKRLAKKYWPGPLSIVATPRFAIRVPDNRLLRTLARRAGSPLIASSLNLSGKPPLFHLRCLPRAFRNILRLDVGPLRKRPPSTVVACKGSAIVLYRAGKVLT